MLDQHGVDNAVATLGTAVTADQAARPLRLADEVIFASTATTPAAKPPGVPWRTACPGPGRQAPELPFPPREDPDSYAQPGTDAFESFCDTASHRPIPVPANSPPRPILTRGRQGTPHKLAEPYWTKLAQALVGTGPAPAPGELTGLAPRQEPSQDGHPQIRPLHPPSPPTGEIRSRRPLAPAAANPAL